MQSHPLRRMHFGQYQTSSAALEWPGDGDCHIMHTCKAGLSNCPICLSVSESSKILENHLNRWFRQLAHMPDRNVNHWTQHMCTWKWLKRLCFMSTLFSNFSVAGLSLDSDGKTTFWILDCELITLYTCRQRMKDACHWPRSVWTMTKERQRYSALCLQELSTLHPANEASHTLHTCCMCRFFRRAVSRKCTR